MSKRRPSRDAARADRRACGSQPPAPDERSDPARPSGSRLSLGAQIALLIGVFLVVTAVADLAGAANLGVAAAIGQIAFAAALVALLLRKS